MARAKTKKEAVNAAAAPEQVFISAQDCYLFGKGTHYDIYKKLGAHPSVENGKEGVFFAVWAPNAVSVCVVGNFNGWKEDEYVMKQVNDGGIHTLFIPGIGAGELYKYCITTKKGEKIYKADPFAFSAELRPGTAS
ncbi:MAG: 1,4-alpha-glucan branching enzyme, partial [Lachnospiraceae bacterium]|nr:1,4-alpha-glucan branching enzyme [Lachnospiraceae bacterium]